ncbi:MAG: tetraacyldisaccharide 4'-kinase [Prevotellaceae bacterium]|nr:tetraacyldisaccharide 4'-kinase [Prevotellaceae bacterium]
MRTEGDFIKINESLLPLSWLYGVGVRFRNWLFDVGLLKIRAFGIPVISVGNITVGGAGKTPHVEYLIRLLKDHVKVGVLSRGYKRKSKGYVLADKDTPMCDIGDEPYQMHRKFPDIYVAVDKKRTEGIDRLQYDEGTKDVDVILLDDAYQHRYVKPGINILLVDYHRLIIYDKLLPAGRLREPQEGKSRADIVIVTKCPKDLKPMEFRVLTKAMDLFPYQELFFTTLDYCPLQPVFGDPKATLPLDSLSGKNILLVTGIASTQQMVQDLRQLMNIGTHDERLRQLQFSDHHDFKDKDIAAINETFAAMPEPRLIVTTEKDAARLVFCNGLSDEVRKAIYALPIKIKFMLDEEENFNSKILSYVRKNSRNSILVKGKDDHKSKDSHHSGHRTGTISFRNN